MGFWEKYRKSLQITTGILVAIIILLTEAKAQTDAGFIYGRVQTVDNTYQGQIRWGKEEAFWNDLLNATKLYRNNYQVLVPKEKKEESIWGDFDWRLSSIWEDKGSSTTHQFNCQFGDIKELEIRGPSRVNLILKNGVVLEVGGEGYNDIGTEINVLDDEFGLVSINWNRLKKIEFLPTPKLRVSMGQPLYGTVITSRKGKFTGFIQWDHDERLDQDKLDGSTSDGNVSIAFANIKQIIKYERGSKVLLKSGQEHYVTGSNDVNSDNRGVIVSVEGVGKISVPWKAFQKVVFSNPKDSGEGYDKYKTPTGMYGTVEQYEGQKTSGRIIYDIDEAWELEILEGNDDEIEYSIPFRNIHKVSPKNYDYSLVTLRNGEALLLGGGRDVSDSNAGMLVFKKGSQDPEHIRWKNITEIVFD